MVGVSVGLVPYNLIKQFMELHLVDIEESFVYSSKYDKIAQSHICAIVQYV